MAENLPVILLATALLWIVLKWWFTPAPAGGPVLCPVCTGAGTVKKVNADSKLQEDVPCPHCYAVGKVSSFKTRSQKVTGACPKCKGRAKIIEHVGPVYPDGTPFPNTTAREIPCPQKGCKGGLTTRDKNVHGTIVPLTEEQLEAELAMAAALLAANKGAKA